MGINIANWKHNCSKCRPRRLRKRVLSRHLRAGGSGRLAELRGVIPEIVYEELRERYRQDPRAFVAGWRTLAQEMRQGFILHASRG